MLELKAGPLSARIHPEIGGIIDLRDDGTVPCTHVAGLVENKLAAVRARIASLTALETELGTLLERSRRLDPADCSDTEVCHILPARR